jgi:hypothetical protein
MMRPAVTRGAAAAWLVLLALASGGCIFSCSYGPAQDRSRFEGAVLMPDQTVLFSFKHLVYRPAQGIAAFPDGGIPKYLDDEDVLGTFHIPSGTLRILRRERNRRWTDGQGAYAIQRSKGSVALVTRAGQLRRDLAKTAFEDWLVDAATGDAESLDWRGELAERGLEMAEMHMADARGTLLFITRPLGSGKGGEGDAWIQVRFPDGEHVRVARTSHFERMEGDDLVYWMPETRRFFAFNLSSRGTRELPGYRVPPYQDVTEGVLVETGGQRIMLGRKDGGAWEYVPLAIDIDRLK